MIAASTGGPQALATLFAGFGKLMAHVPVFVVLHMPDHFTSIVTAQIERISGRPTLAASEGEIARPGTIYFAPGNKHLVLKAAGLKTSMHLDDGEPLNFCKPSANKLFDSATDVYGSSLIAIVLSGMGNDGCAGAKRIAEAAGTVIAQDRETSAVWGMPAAVAEAGIASTVLPIECIAQYAGRLLEGRNVGAAA